MNIRDTYLALGINALRKKDKEEITSRMEENIRRRIALSVLSFLNEEDQKYLNSIIEAGDNEDILIFLEAKIPSMEDLIRKISRASVTEFKELKTAS